MEFGFDPQRQKRLEGPQQKPLRRKSDFRLGWEPLSGGLENTSPAPRRPVPVADCPAFSREMKTNKGQMRSSVVRGREAPGTKLAPRVEELGQVGRSHSPAKSCISSLCVFSSWGLGVTGTRVREVFAILAFFKKKKSAFIF